MHNEQFYSMPIRSFAATKPPAGEEKPKRKRRTKAEMMADRAAKLDAELMKGSQNEEKVPAKRGRKAASKKSDPKDIEPQTMYTLKFNSPILPYAKFPLTQNKYIQDFLRSYEEDKDRITKVIGVHFNKNSNLNAENAVGIEIEIIKKNNITIIESNSNNRYKVLDYDSSTNFSKAVPYEDENSIPLLKDPDEND